MNTFTELYAKKWTKLIKLSLRRNKRVTTGQTAKSVRYILTEKGFKIVGAKHIDNIIKGRGASKSKSGRGWFSNLREWAKIKGFSVSQTWAIYKSINKNGWKTPPTPDLISGAITKKEVKEISEAYAKQFIQDVRVQIKKSI